MSSKQYRTLDPESPLWGPLFALGDPQVRTDPEEAPRLSAQCAAILDRLKRGPATNQELARIALKYTGRISDLRANGHQIEIVSRCRSTGLTIYALKGAA
jgi:hypothetical protein